MQALPPLQPTARIDFSRRGLNLKRGVAAQQPGSALAAGTSAVHTMSKGSIAMKNVALAVVLALAALGMYVGIFLKVTGG
jgi:hypothetical protein